MSLFTFIKEAGEKLFDLGKPVAAAGASTEEIASLNQKASEAILAYINTQNFDVRDLAVAYDGASSTVTVSGTTSNQATREKIVLCCGNVGSVEHVNDQLTVVTASKEARYYTVKSGDTLSKISKEMYSDGNKYVGIFEANQPMLKNPDRIYPGQMLRIPALTS